MSHVFTFTGKSSILTADFNPPLELDDDSQYAMGMTFFQSFYTIPNIVEGVNNEFYYNSENKNGKLLYGNKKISLPTGSYELQAIENYLQERLEPNYISIKPNHSSLKCVIKSDAPIDFTKPNTIRDILGFKSKIIPAGTRVESDSTINIMKTNGIFIDCNITQGSYDNGKMSHYIHHFFPMVAPGWKIVECPEHVIYLPINVRKITNITLKIVDEEGNLLDFRGETITIGLHLKTV